MNTIRITIPLVPKAQKRDRITTIAGKARSYKHKTQILEENKLLSCLMASKPPQPFQGPLSLSVKAYLPIPKSKPKKWQQAALVGDIRPITKPDSSNMVKNIEDVMNGVFMRDDAQIVDLQISKFYGDVPRWEITVRKLP